MVAISLTDPMTSAVVASTTYLEKHGTPANPLELLEHNCIHYRFQSSGQLASWAFSGPDGEYPVEVRGSLIANSLQVTTELAAQGVGIGYTFREYCAEALGSGLLKEILTDHRVSMPSVNIYFPHEYLSLIHI